MAKKSHPSKSNYKSNASSRATSTVSSRAISTVSSRAASARSSSPVATTGEDDMQSGVESVGDDSDHDSVGEVDPEKELCMTTAFSFQSNTDNISQPPSSVPGDPRFIFFSRIVLEPKHTMADLATFSHVGLVFARPQLEEFAVSSTRRTVPQRQISSTTPSSAGARMLSAAQLKEQNRKRI